MMDVADALQIVIDLAKSVPSLSEREQEAINIVEDLAVNEYGDD